MAAPIPAAAFYGSSGRRSAPVSAQLEAAAARLQRAPVCRPPRPSLLGPAVTWRVFPRQAAALQEAAARPGLRLMVFGCEERVPGGGGKRSYLVCHPSVFWQYDEQKSPDSRCSYEVIRQGTPCKLYLDLEYDKTLNTDRDGDAMVDTFIKVMATAVEHLFGVKCARSDVIDLCASSERKFSRHLIFCCRGLVFCDNITVGNLVRDICDAIRSYVINEETEKVVRLGLQNFSKDELSQLLVNSSNENSLFCDEGVYTKNRNFRVYKSSKFGKQRPLIKSTHNTYSPPAKSSRTSRVDSSEEAFFLTSLVSLIEDSSKPLEYGAPSCQRDTASACPTLVGRISHQQSGGPASSPYPDVDRFVRDLVSPGGIRCWNYFDASELLVYDIVGYRFCHNIGRWHRSNNIILVVSLREGSFYQKCHDPACRGFRSDSLPLPDRLLAWRELADDWETEGGDGGTGNGDLFPDCGASDTEMLSAAALTEPDDDPKQSSRPRGTSAAADMTRGPPGAPDGTMDIEPDLAQTTTELPPPDLFPDCGVEDKELAGVPAGACLSQHSCDAPVTNSPSLKPSSGCDESFPDCGVNDSEMLLEMSTEPLPNCAGGVRDDSLPLSMLIEELENGPHLDPESDSFPDCGMGDAELSAIPCSGSRRRSLGRQQDCNPADALDRKPDAAFQMSDALGQKPDAPVELFPDCGVCDWELSEPGESSGPDRDQDQDQDQDRDQDQDQDRDQELFPDWPLSAGSPGPADLFVDCGVGDWEPLEVGRLAGATAAPPVPAASTHIPADTATDAHTVHTPSTGSGSDQLYCTAKTSSGNGHVWDELTEADMSHLQF